MDWIVPMEPILTPNIPEDNGFVHQVKWDGIRGLCYIESGKVRLFTKRGRERTAFYPELLDLPSFLMGKSAVLDGEIIILNEEMRPSFQLSLIRERVSAPKQVHYYAKKYPVLYIVFDLLALNGGLITGKPLHERSSLLRDNLRTSNVTTITDDFYNGSELFSLMKEKGWEGIVSKKADSTYLPGKTHREWFKTKLSRKILAIVVGLALKDGFPNSLVLAISGNEGLVYIGRASIGLTQEHFRLLKDNIPALKADQNPLSKIEEKKETSLLSKNARELKFVVWLKPQLTVWISFLEWTSDGGLRHPKILGFTSLAPEEANGKEFIE